jgi:hypothetical protein
VDVRHNVKFIGLIVLGTLNCSMLTPVAAVTSDRARATLAEVVTVRVFDSDGTDSGFGSGFIIGGGEVVTNAHVVAGAAWAEILDSKGTTLGKVTHAVLLDFERDLAVLSVPGLDSAGLTLAGREPEIGEDIWVFGAPMGLEGTVSRGIVSALRTVGGHRRIQISAPISSGSSGGPVIDRKGDVVGVVVSTMSEGQNLNFAVSVTELQELLQGRRGQHPFPDHSDMISDVEFLYFLHLMYRIAVADAIQIGDTRHGSLGEHRVVIYGLADFYQFEGREGEEVDIGVQSTDFDAMVDLLLIESLGSDDLWSVRDDDGGVGTDARLRVTLPLDGTYAIIVHAYDDIEGYYTLTTREDELQVSSLREGDRWIHITDVPEARVDYDNETLRRTGGRVAVWVRWSYLQPQVSDGNERYDIQTMLYSFDCRARRFKLKSYSLTLRGTFVSGADVPSYLQQWQNIVPDTVGEEIYQCVCR